MSPSQATLVQITDTHLLEGEKILHGRIDTWSRTVAALSAAAHFAPDAVIVTGDIADRGHQIHARAAKLFERAEEELGCPVIVVPGNHDPAGAVGAGFNRSSQTVGPFPADTVHQVAGVRIVGLESHGFGQAQGTLTQEQLQWMLGVLAKPAPGGSVLAMHHPPIEATLPGLAGRGLANPAELAAVLEGSDVHAILCGHYHLPSTGNLGTIPVWVAPAVSYNHNLFAPSNLIQALDTSWISVVKIAGSTLSASPVQVSTAPAVFTHEVAVPVRHNVLL